MAYMRTRHLSFLMCLMVGFLFAPASVRAQSWVPVGVPGGNVRALAQDPSDSQRVYLGTADGILYRSDDGGLQWHRLNPGFPLRGCILDAVVVNGHGVFVGYWDVRGSGGGVARSSDGGQTFVVQKGIQGESVRSLALSPSDPRVIAAGTLAGVFLSRNSGQSWTRITPAGHPDLRNVESLIFDPNDSEILYAGTWHLIWKTLDGGATWAPAHRGMIDDSDVMTLTIDRQHPQNVYATACSGIYRSTEGGEPWTKLEGIPFSSRRTRAFAQGDDGGLLLAGTTEGLWVSEDRGGTWNRTTSGDLVVNAVTVLRDGTILLGTEGAGILRSSDRGRTWVAGNRGFSERFVFKVAFDPEGGRVVVAVWDAHRYGGVFVSPRVGGPWTRMAEGLDGRQVLALALRGPTIFAGTDAGIFVRRPAATAWIPLRILIDGRGVLPRVTELLALPSGSLLAATSTGVVYSPDDGMTWTQPALKSTEEVLSLAASPNDPDLVVAATPTGFFRSHDGGASWSQVSAGLRVATPHALAFLPSDEPVLFATTSGGLYRSGDQGGTWRRVNGGIPHADLTGLATSPDGRTVYASDFDWGGIFRSTDGGATWERMPTDGLASDRVWALNIDPAEPERLVAAASAGGLNLLVPPPIAAAEPTKSR